MLFTLFRGGKKLYFYYWVAYKIFSSLGDVSGCRGRNDNKQLLYPILESYNSVITLTLF